MKTETFERVTLYNAETGQTLELNGVQESSIAEEVIAEELQKAAQAEIDRLRDKVANLEIRCRILEAKLEEADHER